MIKDKTKNIKNKNIPAVKIKAVKEMKDLFDNSKTILIASIKNIPSSQYQEIGKRLRGKAVVKVPKKKLAYLAIDASKREQVKALKEKLGDSFALLFSNLDAYELAGELIKNRSPSKAKAGQIAPDDIEIQAGPTDLVPGPAISELGALGIQIMIQGGKIEIKANKIITKKGEKISEKACDVMNKLGIKPFTIGFQPVCAFDADANIIYTELNIDVEGTLAEMKNLYSKGLAFAVAIGYANEDTIKLMLTKAYIQGTALEKFTNTPETKTGEEN